MRIEGWALGALLATLLACGPPGAPSDAPSGVTPIAGPLEPTVILISMDGFRADYFDLVEVPNLRRLAAEGVRAEGLIPVFPSYTFPCHYSIVTGLYPGSHGIISNSIRDAELGEFSHRDPPSTKDPRWWGGEPIWVTAERQGVTTATMFWPGSEVEIAGAQPTYWHTYDGDMPYEARVAQVLEWLELPPDRRPRLITLYFQDPNNTAHEEGPEAAETFAAARQVDARLGDLVAGLEARGVGDQVHLVVVSDHGMAGVDRSRFVVLEEYVDFEDDEVFEQGALLQIFPAPGRESLIYDALRDAHPHLAIYRRDEIPERFHLRDSPRAPPILGVPEVGWEVVTSSLARHLRASHLEGNHGQDPGDPRMHGLFVAAGPRLRSGVVTERFESVEIYNLLAAVLGLEPALNDGDPEGLKHLLRR